MRIIIVCVIVLIVVLFTATSAYAQTQVGHANLRRGTDLHKIIVEQSQNHNVSVDLALAVIAQESAGRCSVTSYSGAIGLMQIKYATARDIGYRGSPHGLYDCRINTQYGMKYLAMATEKANGETCLTLHYYFSGLYAGNVITASSVSYCKSVMKYYVVDADPVHH